MLLKAWQEESKKTTQFIWAKVEEMKSGSYPLFHKKKKKKDIFSFCLIFIAVIRECYCSPVYSCFTSKEKFHSIC